MTIDLYSRAKRNHPATGCIYAGFYVPLTLRLLFASLTVFASFLTGAQEFPSRPVRLVVPTGAGASQDIIARILAPELSKTLAQTLVIENKPGSGQLIGIEYVISQP